MAAMRMQDRMSAQSPLTDNVWLQWRLAINNDGESNSFSLEHEHVLFGSIKFEAQGVARTIVFSICFDM